MQSIIPKIFHNMSFVQAPDAEHKYIDRCLESQQELLKDWQWYTWNEEDFIHIISTKDWHIPNGTKLLEIGAWAIISDIIRLYALYEYGGLYADWDVEFLRAIPDEMLIGEQLAQISPIHSDTVNSREKRVILGFEPYTLNGRASAQVGVQCALSSPKHPLWKKIYARIRDTLWSEHFDILPGLCTRILEELYNLPSARNNNVYYYLRENIAIFPMDVFYPFMGTRVYKHENIDEPALYKTILKTTIAIHWEHSQIEYAQNTKRGWTQYLCKLRSNNEQ